MPIEHSVAHPLADAAWQNVIYGACPLAGKWRKWADVSLWAHLTARLMTCSDPTIALEGQEDWLVAKENSIEGQINNKEGSLLEEGVKAVFRHRHWVWWTRHSGTYAQHALSASHLRELHHTCANTYDEITILIYPPFYPADQISNNIYGNHCNLLDHRMKHLTKLLKWFVYTITILIKTILNNKYKVGRSTQILKSRII